MFMKTKTLQKQIYKKLARSNKTIVTPHVAGWSQEAEFKIADILSKKIIDAMKA